MKNIDRIINENISKFLREERNDFSICQETIDEQLDEANDFLSQYGLSVIFNYKYNFANFPYLAVYQNRSVKNNGRIRIGINLPLLQQQMKVHKISKKKLSEQIIISIWHEVGHGIVEWFKMLRRRDTQNKTKIFRGEMLNYFKSLIADEEEVVEEFGAYWADYCMNSYLMDFLTDYEDEIEQMKGLDSLNQKYI